MTSLKNPPDSDNKGTQDSQSDSVSELKPLKNKSVSFSSNTKSSTPSVTPGPSGRGAGTQKRPLPQKKKQVVNTANMKKENLAKLIQKKKELERQAHEIVLRLIVPNVKKEFLLENAIKISKHHMEDVIEERKLSELCGWVLCDNRVDLNNIPKQTYKIRGHKVYDIRERKSFCDGKCYAKAVHFKAQLLTSPLWLRDLEEDISFEILEDDETKEVHGLSVALTSVTLSDNESDQEDDYGETNADQDSRRQQQNDINVDKELVMGDIVES